MKKGNIVIVTRDMDPYYKAGDKAKLIKTTGNNDWLADFTMNKDFYGDGEWHLNKSNMKLSNTGH